MRFRIVAAIVAKELTETLRDRRSLLMMVGLPALLYPLLVIAMSRVQATQSSTLHERPGRVAVWGTVPADFADALDASQGLTFLEHRGLPAHLRNALASGTVQAPPLVTPSDLEARSPGSDEGSGRPTVGATNEPDSPVQLAARSALASDLADCVVVFWPDLAEALEQDGVGRLTVYYDSVRPISRLSGERVLDLLGPLRREIVARRERDHNLPAGFASAIDLRLQDVATRSRRAGQAFGTFLPFLLISLSLFGAFYPAIDLTAGEKERGTLQTLLCAPVMPTELIAGKFLSVWILTLLATLANITSLGATVARVLPAASGQIPVERLVFTFVMLLPVTFIIAAIFLTVAIFAKDFKDAQNFLTPVYMALVLPAAVTVMPGMALTPWTAFVPIVNIALLVKAWLIGDIDADLAFMTMVSSIAAAMMALLLAARVFAREQVLLGGRAPLAAVWGPVGARRYAGTPSPTFALTLFAVVLVLQFYGSLLLAPRGLPTMLLGSQLGLLLLPVLAAILVGRFDVRATLTWRRPARPALWGAVLVGLSAWAVSAGITLRLLPPPDTVTRSLERVLLGGDAGLSVWALVALVGILPAVCEELLFRGFVLTGLRRLGVVPACVGSALLFAVAHASLYRLLPTFCLGVIFALLVWYSRSLLTSIVAHAVNNLALLAMSRWTLAPWLGLSDTDLPWLVTLAGAVLVGLGLWVAAAQPARPGLQARARPA